MNGLNVSFETGPAMVFLRSRLRVSIPRAGIAFVQDP